MFDAGPYVSCYRARSLTDGSFTGVRCVKFANLIHFPNVRGVAFVWYAEGLDQAGPYRHFGEAFLVPNPAPDGPILAHAAGITGNGERAEPFLRLLVSPDRRLGSVPERVRISGDRQEDWELVPDGRISDYTPLPRHVERNGPLLREFKVRRDGTPGFGVRSMLSSGSWIGSGRWLDMTYLHLGTYIVDPAGMARYGVSDIAAGNHYCNVVPWGEISLRADAGGPVPFVRTSGTWSETWELRRAATGWNPDPAVADVVAAGTAS
ncbi:hypothetical protein [Kitasatospora sp. MAP5-34]|uniref:hypothetical protein n=1 Tax=Kitasatospora sp. MAP5-34 TaxID=3035102 RepID=UPI00247478AE|nr:hypothetical protein [Kitasatospora sp. MAP5-34]MDH6580821.1 hypothetical protein [Kitasatospora sp. MAP5-34]